MKFSFLRNTFIITLLSILTIGCGSDSSGVKVATINSDNTEALAIAGTEGVKQGVNNDSISLFAQVGEPSPMQKLTVLSAQTLPQAGTTTYDICDSGTVEQSFSGDQNSASGTITYTSCVIGGVTFNGTATFSSSTSGSKTTFKITYKSFTVSFNSETETIDSSSTCVIDSNAGTVSCTYDSSGTGIDGRTYKVTKTAVTGDDYNGWTVSATVQDPDYGKITVETITPVMFGCSNGQPMSGSIKISTPKNSMTVTYNDCSSFTIDFDGSTTTSNW